MKTCTECRHWNLRTDNPAEIAMFCGKQRFGYYLLGVLAEDVRKTLRTARMCPDFQPMEPFSVGRVADQAFVEDGP